MALAGYLATLSIGGTSTALTNEATTLITSGLVYQITNAAHQALDPTVAAVVQVSPDNSTWSTPTGTYSVDYTSGVVTFAVNQSPNTFCRFQSGNYIPLLTVAQARKCSWMMKREVADATVFGAAGAKQRVPLLLDASGSLEDLTPFREDLNTVLYDAAHRWFDDIFLPANKVFLAFQPGGSGNQQGRAWVYVEQLEEAFDVGSIVVGSVSWQLAPVVPVAAGTANLSWR